MVTQVTAPTNPTQTPAQIAEAQRLAAVQQQERDDQERQRLAAEQQAVGATQDAGIFGAIKQFLKFFFDLFLGNNNAENPGEDTATPPDSAADRLRMGETIVNSHAVPNWATFQQAHRGTVVRFASPVNGNAQVTSGFGHRTAPTTATGHGSSEHAGLDIGARGGDASPDILAAADGVVLFSGRRSGYGNAVIIGHADGSTTLYGHMTGTHMPTVGKPVVKGEQIGEMGSTGNSTGRHVHFEVRDRNGVAITPKIDGVAVSMSALLVGHETMPRLPVSDGSTVNTPTVASVRARGGNTLLS